MANNKLPNIATEPQYTILYSGSKHFWKQRCHVDFHIMWHKSKNLIEIANFNVDMHEEGTRLFCDPEKLFLTVNKEEVETKVRTKQEELMRQRKPRVLAEELAQTITAQMAVQGVIQRAVLAKTPTDGKKFQVVLNVNPDDELLEDGSGRVSFLAERPEGFEDTEIQRKKKATAQEFRQTLEDLKRDSRKLSLANSKAARKAGLAKSAVSAFTGCMSRYTYDPEKMSAAKIRFLKAGRKIIVLNTVRKITALLERLERASMSEIPSPTKIGFQQEMGFFPTLNSSPSMNQLASENGRRAARPHHRLKPVRAATKSSPASIGASTSTPTLPVNN
jgi:hypothetical protein